MLRSFIITFVTCFLVIYFVLVWVLKAPTWSANPPISLQTQVDAKTLQRHVETLTSLPQNRSIHHPESLARAGEYIESTMAAYGYELEKQWVQAGDLATPNYIARFIPPHIALDQPWIVVGAHYDAALEDNPGADDNASGVAGLLELARLLRNNEVRIRYPVELVFYTTEEPPFFATKKMGSEIHAQEFQKANKQVRLMYSLEMIGYFTNAPNSQNFPMPILKLFYPTTGDFIGIIGLIFDNRTTQTVKKSFRAIEGLNTYSINAPKTLKGVDFSDHKNYWSRGWPAVMITDTAFLRNDQYHLPGDTADRLNYGKMALVVQALFQSLNDLD